MLAPSPARAESDAEAKYYISLGDSLAAGAQVDGGVDQGYADQLYGALRQKTPQLLLQKYGCSGENSSRMRDYTDAEFPPPEGCGGGGYYRERYPNDGDYDDDGVPENPPHSQLTEALSLIDAHPRQISLVTLNIGANDVFYCLATVDQACFDEAVGQLDTNVRATIVDLQEALSADPAARIVGMTYYNPFLILDPPLGPKSPQTQMVDDLNAVLIDAYEDMGVGVARPDLVFVDRERVCEWTTFCTRADYHPNTTGYCQIANTFIEVLARGGGSSNPPLSCSRAE